MGITEDLVIIGQVINILLTMQGKQFSRDSRSLITSELNHAKIELLLKDALDQVQDASLLFDRYVLFRLDNMLPGGRYPTPRHIVRHMITLAQVQSAQSMVDFACGTGGFLVNLPAENTIDTLLGIEISREWAELAQANTVLHNIPAEITTGNALRVYSKIGSPLFDRVLMNPPFGESVDAELAEKAVGFATGSNSETALMSLALVSLAPGGRAAVLVPSGVLQNNSRGEKELRQRLLDDYSLEAVVTYPKDAFQPFSKLTTHLLLTYNHPPQPESLTWFFKAGSDGYETGRGRDLTRDPKYPNDLHSIEILFLNSQLQVNYDDKPLHVTTLADDGHIIRVALNSRIISARYYYAFDRAKAFILLTVKSDNNQTAWQLSVEDGSLTPVTQDLESFLKSHYKKSTKDQPTPMTLFQNQTDNVSLGESLAISSDGNRLLGVAIPQETLRQRYYSLDPKQYLKAPVEEVKMILPETLLQNIRENQRDLGNRIETLIGWVIPSGEIPKLPSPVKVSDNPLIGQLNLEQQAIWQKIQTLVDEIPVIDGEPYQTGRYFKPDAPELMATTEAEVVRMTLDILEQMGLIVLVTQKNPLTNDMMTFYRLVEERDEWKPQS